MPDRKLVFGLGNPGMEYHNTRHNIGFLILDELAKRYGVAWRNKLNSQYTEFIENGIRVLLIKPLTYMNLSGNAVAQWVGFYKVSLDNILVVLDDISLPFGAVRFRKKGSHGGHNGLKSIINSLGTSDFPRMRVGVGAPPPNVSVVDWVLGEFSLQEQKKLPELLSYCADAVEVWAIEGIDKAASKFNRGSI